MQKRLTVTIDSHLYDELHSFIDKRKISKFVEDMLRHHLIKQNLDNSYRMMSEDRERENDALEWSEGTLGDVCFIVRPAELTSVLDTLISQADDLGAEDLSANVDHYLYGLPKKLF
ncbi:MAG: hypothetical protein AB7S75_02975 [Desulfococcaceae bacterium]